jgi:hypothetical protein
VEIETITTGNVMSGKSASFKFKNEKTPATEIIAQTPIVAHG